MIVVPLAWGMWLSATKSDLFGTEGWVGLANFARLFGDPIFLQTVWNTFYFVLLTVPLLAVLGLALALVLNRPARWAAVLRTRSEEHTSELQSLMRISYAVSCSKNNTSHS